MKEKETNHPVKLPEFTVEEVFTSFAQSIDWSLKYQNIPNTWKVTQGEGVTIAVIDTGMPDHVDIGDNAIEGKNFIAGEDIYDYNGHQTHCVGIISAKNNQSGYVGVAPKARCICIKALNKSGSGNYAGLCGALESVKELKPDIVSMSLGGTQSSPQMQKLIQEITAMNIPVVCAAGNTAFAGVNYPAAFPETIAVASYDKHGNISYFSSRGAEVDWAAPGSDISSTFLNNGYASLSGTSMACPFIAGVIALMISKHNKQEKETGKNDCKTVADIRNHLLKYTNDKGTVGKDNDWGYGVLDVEKMIAGESEDDNPFTPPHPEPEPEEPEEDNPFTPPPPPKEEPKPRPKPPTNPPPSNPPAAPEPTPEPEPAQPPVEKTPFWKKHIAWIVMGIIVLACVVAFLYGQEEKPESLIEQLEEKINRDMNKWDQ